ncbi:MAG: redoxin domain-containing protein, partial [Gammaproteobacteria bacterium]|nr:redoxin domain-containing protein [Gammaproteobacteria bacterium]
MRHHSVILACLTLSTTAWALNPNDRVDNFELLDQTGASHELYYLSDASAVVLMSHGNGCSAVSDVIPQFKAVRAAYEKQGVAFLMINSNLGDSREAIARDARELGIDTPILMDETQIIGESLGLTRTAEVLVINTANWQLAYRGSPSQLENTLDSVLKGELVKVAKTEASGCEINFPERARRGEHAQISYS